MYLEVEGTGRIVDPLPWYHSMRGAGLPWKPHWNVIGWPRTQMASEGREDIDGGTDKLYSK